MPPPLTVVTSSPRALISSIAARSQAPVAGQRRVRHQPVEAQTGQRVDELGEVGGRRRASARRCERSPVSHSTRNPTSVPARGERRREPAGDDVGVADDGHDGLTGERREPLRLRGADERER